MEDVASVAHAAADAADAIIRSKFRRRFTVENKLQERDGLDRRAYDPVTEVDRAAEEAIRTVIRDHFPGDGILGEEFGSDPGTSGQDWVIDPIDGTRSFMAGFPTFGLLIGMLRHAKPTFGLMSQAFTGERYWGSSASTTYRGPDGERRVQTRPCETLGEAVLSSTNPDLFDVEDEKPRFEAINNRVRVTRYGGDCYAYCLVAAGHIDIVIESGLAPYDIAPLIPIIEGAGGQVTTWTGETAKDGGRVVATGDRRLHDMALKLLAD